MLDVAPRSPLALEPVDRSTRAEQLLLDHFMPAWRKGYLRCGDKRVTMPKRYAELARPILDLAVRPDDVWVVSHPKAGTTWTQEMVWLLGNDLDYEGAKVILTARFPFLENTALFDHRTMGIHMPDLPEFIRDSVGFVDGFGGRRFIKTHLPHQLLPTQLQDPKCTAKIVYVCRNAKDTCVSYYHHCRLLEGYTGNFRDFCEMFLEGAVCSGPFWPHVLDFWERRNQPNVLFITYEQLKQDLAGVIRRTADFLGTALTDDDLGKLKHHLSFESMKKNPAVNYEVLIDFNRKYNLSTVTGSFMRSGQVGNWKGVMSPQLSQRFDQWSERNLQGSGLQL